MALACNRSSMLGLSTDAVDAVAAAPRQAHGSRWTEGQTGTLTSGARRNTIVPGDGETGVQTAPSDGEEPKKAASGAEAGAG